MNNANAQLEKKAYHSAQLRVTQIHVSELRVGMSISELDRPWTETPFLLQGFVVNDVEELEQVREYCEYVYIEETYAPKSVTKSKPKITVTSYDRRTSTLAASNQDLPDTDRSAGGSFTKRMLLVALLLCVPVQTSAEGHNPVQSSQNSAQAR